MDYSLPGSSVHGVSQQENWSGLPFSTPGDLLNPETEPTSLVSPILASFRVKSLQLCLTLCDPINCSPPGSSVHGILQARILEWVSMLSSRGSSPPRD